MVINLWSTPRTGSVWYSQHLEFTHNLKRLTEMFNPYHMGLYKTMIDGVITNHDTYKPNANYKYEHFFLDDGILKSEYIYAERNLNPTEELEYRKNLIFNMSINNNLVFHNHIYPIDQEIKDHLTNIADRNIYIHRIDILAQLASYTIAVNTKRFAQTVANTEPHEIINDVPRDKINHLIERIKVWQNDPKLGELIAYEDIQFYEKPNMLVKQVGDYRTVLSPSAIDELVQLADQGGIL